MNRAYGARKRVQGHYYAVSWESGSPSALHVAAPKAVFARAVDRNREKRRVRALFRTPSLSGGIWMVRVLRSSAGVSFSELKTEVAALVECIKRDIR